MNSVNQATFSWAQARRLPSFFLPEVTSTNDWAKAEFAALDKPAAVYLADHQTQGRGRHSRTWTNTSPGQTLLASFCFSCRSAPQPIFPPLVGLAVFKALGASWPDLPLALKAPNDIYLENGKLAGLLIEITSTGNRHDLIIGLGMNVLDAPDLDIPTTALASQVAVNEKSWSLFMDTLYSALQIAIKQGMANGLSETQLREIHHALSRLDNHQVEQVFADGSLLVAGTHRHWRDL